MQKKEEQGQTDKPEDTPQNAAGKDSNSLEYERFLRMEYTLVHENLFLQPDFGTRRTDKLEQYQQKRLAAYSPEVCQCR